MKFHQFLFLATFSILTLASCKQETVESTSNSEEAAAQSFTVTAEVMYRERMLAPPGSSLTVTLEDVSIADKASTVLAEQIIGIDKNTQLPQKITLQVPKEELVENHAYALRAKLEDPDGLLMWTTTERKKVDTSQSSHELGQVILKRVQS